MGKQAQKEPLNQHQPYDKAIKAMFKEDAATIIPLLLPDSTLLETLDIEVVQSVLRADRAYRVHRYGGRYIAQFEFQAGSDTLMAERLLIYHANMLYEHKLPVLSIVVYLFPCSIAKSPMQKTCESRNILTFHFDVICMWQQDARSYVEKRAMGIYPLLPTMAHASVSLLLHAIEELIQYYQDQEELLARRLLWMMIFLNRTETITKLDKEKVMQRLDTFQKLFEEDDFVRQQRALGKAEGKIEGKLEGKLEGKAEGKLEGKLEGKAEMLMTIIKVRFPALYQVVLPRIHTAQTANPNLLDEIASFVIVQSNEATVRDFIETKLPL